MRWLVFGAILLSRPRNALLMVVWLPPLSLLTSGHPVFPRVVLIQDELVLNVLLIYSVARRTNSLVAGVLVSVVTAEPAGSPRLTRTGPGCVRSAVRPANGRTDRRARRSRRRRFTARTCGYLVIRILQVTCLPTASSLAR